jgi:hypothetical protein
MARSTSFAGEHAAFAWLKDGGQGDDIPVDPFCRCQPLYQVACQVDPQRRVCVVWIGCPRPELNGIDPVGDSPTLSLLLSAEIRETCIPPEHQGALREFA